MDLKLPRLMCLLYRIMHQFRNQSINSCQSNPSKKDEALGSLARAAYRYSTLLYRTSRNRSSEIPGAALFVASSITQATLLHYHGKSRTHRCKMSNLMYRSRVNVRRQPRSLQAPKEYFPDALLLRHSNKSPE
jgi:hypothetical protein